MLSLRQHEAAAQAERERGQAQAAAARQTATAAAQDIASLSDDLGRLVERAAQTVALDETRRGPAQKSIDDTEARIRAARAELAAHLGKRPEAVLRESGEDPSDRLSQASEQSAGVKAALERGDVAAAQSGLDTVTQRVGEAAAIVESTRTAFAEHTKTLAGGRGETGRFQSVLPEPFRRRTLLLFGRLRREPVGLVTKLRNTDYAVGQHPRALFLRPPPRPSSSITVQRRRWAEFYYFLGCAAGAAAIIAASLPRALS